MAAAALSVLTAFSIGAAGMSATNAITSGGLTVSALAGQTADLLDSETLRSAARQNAQALGLDVTTADEHAVVLSLGQWLTVTNSGMNFELFDVTRSTPVYVADFRGHVDNRALESDFRYDRVIVAVRADTGASMGYIALPFGESFTAITVDLPDHYVERIPPTRIAPPPVQLPDAADS